MQFISFLSWIYWNPPRDAFTIPLINISVAWYGILFASGFILGYFIFVPVMARNFTESNPSLSIPARKLSIQFTDKLTWFVIIGTIVGARLGHVFFYDWPFYAAHPLEIVMIRKGGLASHGGAIGVLVGLFLFLGFLRKQFPNLSLISLMDAICIPTALTVCCIRLGNFLNQEILGVKSSLPWAVVFGNPADGTMPAPRHPVQLYEAAAYLFTFFILYALWNKRGLTLKPGTLSGLFFIFVFGSRFFIEFLKLPQSMILEENFLQTGQYLSIPFIGLGIVLLYLPARFFASKASPFMLQKR